VVKTPWYYGWGSRLPQTGWLWNVSGLDGVKVQFDDGRRFRVGSDEPNNWRRRFSAKSGPSSAPLAAEPHIVNTRLMPGV
jgi:hypothetical protein